MDQVPSRARRLLRHSIAAGLLLVVSIPLGGCRMCAECNDLDYPAYGGAWQRTRRDGGRVASVFDPAGAKATDLIPRDEPVTPDERQRQMRRESEQAGDTIPDAAEPSEPESAESPEAESPEMESPDRTTPEIEIPGEEELRGRTLDDIDVKIIPGDPLPPVLR